MHAGYRRRATTVSQTSKTSGDHLTPTFHVLPTRLITVFGLESSGTTILTSTLASAVGAKEVLPDLVHRTMTTNESKRTEIQHVSLPWGWNIHGQEGKSENEVLSTIDVIPPMECMVYPHYPLKWKQIEKDAEPADPNCRSETGFTERVRLPQRFMVNITSHVKWYQERGVQVTAVVMVRDDYAHMQGKFGTHNKNMTLAIQEDSHAKRLIENAMSFLSSHEVPPQLILVSYETLMSLQKPYLFDLYRQLEINSTYMPGFQSGNKKYVPPPKESDDDEWNMDPVNLTALTRRR